MPLDEIGGYLGVTGKTVHNWFYGGQGPDGYTVAHGAVFPVATFPAEKK